MLSYGASLYIYKKIITQNVRVVVIERGHIRDTVDMIIFYSTAGKRVNLLIYKEKRNRGLQSFLSRINGWGFRSQGELRHILREIINILE